MFPTKVDVFVVMIKIIIIRSTGSIIIYYSSTTLHSDLYSQKAYYTIYTKRIWFTVVRVVYLRVLLLSLLLSVWFDSHVNSQIILWISSRQNLLLLWMCIFFLLIRVFLHLLWCLHRIYFAEKCCCYNIIHDLYWNAFE